MIRAAGSAPPGQARGALQDSFRPSLTDREHQASGLPFDDEDGDAPPVVDRQQTIQPRTRACSSAPPAAPPACFARHAGASVA